MKKFCLLLMGILLFAACVAHQEFRPDFNKYVDNVVEIGRAHV